jgi:hypothetical protein
MLKNHIPRDKTIKESNYARRTTIYTKTQQKEEGDMARFKAKRSSSEANFQKNKMCPGVETPHFKKKLLAVFNDAHKANAWKKW